MSQNSLIEKIKKDAATTVAEIKANTATEVESIQREIEAGVAKLKKEHESALEKEKSHMELVAVSKAKQSGNIALQRAKREQIDAIFSAVANDLQDQPSGEYVAFFQKYADEIMPDKVEVDCIHAPKGKEEETKDLMKALKLDGDVKSDTSIKAGMVVYAKDGVYDITLERLMNEKRAELEMVVVNTVKV